MGSEYGGWWVNQDLLQSSSVVYSVGVGEDTSFDEALIEQLKVQVYAFDPTPRTASWLSTRAIPNSFHFVPAAIWKTDGTALFYPPRNPSHVSHTLLSIPSRESKAFRVRTMRLATAMGELGHDRIDLLKLDVEGAEYEILQDMLKSDIKPYQLAVEFHHGQAMPFARTRQAIRSLRSEGYQLMRVSSSGREFTLAYQRSQE